MMSNKERREMAAARKILRQEGILPLKRPRVNRKKYCEMVNQLWKDTDVGFTDIYAALSFVTPPARQTKIDDVEYTALRIRHMAILHRQFRERLKESGREQCTYKELFDAVYSPVFPPPEYVKTEE